MIAKLGRSEVVTVSFFIVSILSYGRLRLGIVFFYSVIMFQVKMLWFVVIYILFNFYIVQSFDFSEYHCAFAENGVIYNSNRFPKNNQFVYIGVLSYTKEVNIFFAGPYQETLALAKSYQILLHQEHYPLIVFYSKKSCYSLIEKLTNQDIICLVHYDKYAPGGAWKIIGKPLKGNQLPFFLDFFFRHRS